jgi:small GTP-binding protein
MSQNLYIFKIIVAGDSGVGKTTLIRRYVDNMFISSKKATIGIDYFVKNVGLQISDNRTNISLQIWDLAGEEKYRSFLPSYIPGTHGIIFVFSEDVKNSLNYLNNFIDVLNILLKEKIPMILIKAKNDLNENPIESKTTNDFMNNHGITTYFDTSAKTGENVSMVFQKISELIFINKNLSEI